MSDIDQYEPQPKPSISRIAVAGYKSIAGEQSIAVAPLTVLAGANSSGKSSIMQPLLLWKQTLEASYDPGPLLLDGPLLRFTNAEQLLSPNTRTFAVSVSSADGASITTHYVLKPEGGFDLDSMDFVRASDASSGTLRLDSTPAGVVDALPEALKKIYPNKPDPAAFRIARHRGFLAIAANTDTARFDVLLLSTRRSQDSSQPIVSIPDALEPAAPLLPLLKGLIHVPGLRGNPERAYPRTEVGEQFPGRFENYIASLIHHWARADEDRFSGLIQDLRDLGIARYLKAQRLDDTRVELRVARLPAGERFGNTDLVNIADVGFGVSQALPVLAALRAAAAGQLVYIEQPELHLHPRAQALMADILVGAARHGVRVVVETHSDLLLRGIQTAIAKGRIASADVSLNWFTRDLEKGLTTVTKAELDADGAFGEWPADFDDVALRSEGEYLDAVEARHRS